MSAEHTGLCIISDSYYSQSTWYHETISGIQSALKQTRSRINLRILADPIDKINVDALPDVVIVTNGNKDYLVNTVNALAANNRHVLLACTNLATYSSSVSSVTFDIHSEMNRLIQYLLHHGKRKIALVGFGRFSVNDMRTYYSALEAMNVNLCDSEMENSFLWNTTVSESIEGFLQKAHLFQAVICPNDAVALLLANSCKFHGVSIPHDLFLVGMCGMKIGKLCDPPLTTVAEDFFRLGNEIFHIWSYLYGAKNRCSINATIPCRLIIRKSTDFLPEFPWFGIKHGTEEVVESLMESNRHLFFSDPFVSPVMQLESQLFGHDDLDVQLISCMLLGKSLETISAELFVSSSTLKYRVRKLYNEFDVSSRADFEAKLKEGLYSTYTACINQ